MNKLLTTLGTITLLSSGVSPLATINTINHSEIKTIQHKQVKYTDYLPFNASAFDNSASNQGGYYAYYKHSAFDNPFGNHWCNGYVAQLSLSSMPYLMASYNDAISKHENAIVAIQTYITAAYDSDALTKFTSGWSLNPYIMGDSGDREISVWNKSMSDGDASVILNLIKLANLYNQTLTFFYYLAYPDVWHDLMKGRIQIYNPITKASYSTPWQTY